MDNIMEMPIDKVINEAYKQMFPWLCIPHVKVKSSDTGSAEHTWNGRYERLYTLKSVSHIEGERYLLNLQGYSEVEDRAVLFIHGNEHTGNSAIVMEHRDDGLVVFIQSPFAASKYIPGTGISLVGDTVCFGDTPIGKGLPVFDRYTHSNPIEQVSGRGFAERTTLILEFGEDEEQWKRALLKKAIIDFKQKLSFSTLLGHRLRPTKDNGGRMDGLINYPQADMGAIIKRITREIAECDSFYAGGVILTSRLGLRDIASTMIEDKLYITIYGKRFEVVYEPLLDDYTARGQRIAFVLEPSDISIVYALSHNCASPGYYRLGVDECSASIVAWCSLEVKHPKKHLVMTW